ncbi:MAG: mobile mystery protein A [Parvibaculum sp.]|nr:mobile mystery protein A [Parvibaculum sp.]
MTVKRLAAQQYRAIADRAAPLARVTLPDDGWIATVRKALGMSGAELARRLGVTRARVSQAEQAEREGGVSLKTMQAMAEAMGCRFVYAIVPVEGRIEGVVAAQARKKAEALVARASTHMALERQALPAKKNKAEVARVARALMEDPPPGFWSEK